MGKEGCGEGVVPPLSARSLPRSRTISEKLEVCGLCLSTGDAEAPVVIAGAPPPHSGQRENTGLHFLTERLGHRHRQACV